VDGETKFGTNTKPVRRLLINLQFKYRSRSVIQFLDIGNIYSCADGEYLDRRGMK
jgi:hypothetical protein